MVAQNEVVARISAGGRKTTPQKPKSAEKKKAAKRLFVVKLKRIPFGFFEREMLGYFRQFGNVLRIRVARSRKTGNHKGWAYVGFDNKAVAEIAAESMDGYLMFEQRLGCKVMKPSAIPKSMLKGPLLVMRPSYMGLAKKDAIARNNASGKNDAVNAHRRQKTLKKTLDKLKANGIDYDFETAGKAPKTPVKAAADPDVQVITTPKPKTPVTTPKTKIAVATPKTKIAVATPKTPVEKMKIAEKTPKFSPKTRAGKAAAALAAATPAAKSTLSKTIMKSVAASARPAPLKNPLATARRGKKKSL